MAKRGPAERAANPSVVVHDGPEVCARCMPLLAREEKFHAEAFQALAQSLDATLARLHEPEAALRFLKEYEREIRQGLTELWHQAELGNSDFTERQAEAAFGAHVALSLKKGVTPDVTP